MPANIQVNWDYEALGKGVAALFSTYSDTMPYQHRFNDELYTGCSICIKVCPMKAPYEKKE